MKQEGYDGFIPDQNKQEEIKEKIEDNLFHKDNSTYLFDEDAFQCPSVAILLHKSTT